MHIKGIGTVRKEDAMKFLTKEGRDAVKSGEITPEELGAIYKLELVKRASAIGSCQDTFNACYDRVPEEVLDKLSPEEIASVVDAFYKCYGDGKAAADEWEPPAFL